MALRLPSIDSATYKAIITAVQTFAAFLVAATANQDIMALITDYYPAIVPVVSAAAGLAALILGLVRSDVKNY